MKIASKLNEKTPITANTVIVGTEHRSIESHGLDRYGLRRNRLFFSGVFIMAVLAFISCGEKEIDKKKTKEINLAVKENSKLQESTEDLLEKRGSLIRLKKKLSKQRSELEKRKQNIPEGDKKAAAAIQAEEADLEKRERRLYEEEGDLNTKLSQLLKQRSALLTKATTALTAAAASSSPPKIAHREHTVSQREKGLAGREKELAEREANLAKREADIAKREKELAKGCVAMAAPVYTVTQIEAPRNPGSRSYSKSDVKSAYDKALHAMSSRGIMISDLPPGVGKLRSDILSYMKNKEYYRGKLSADQLLKIIRSISIDRGFVGAKMARLHRRINKKKLSSDKEKKANNLFVQATSDYSNGRFKQANSKLNRIFALTR